MESREIYNDFGTTSRLDTNRCVDVSIRDNGSICFQTMDSGDAPESHFGKEDYEFSVSVSPENYDALILSLLGTLEPELQLEMTGKCRNNLLLDLLQKIYTGQSGAVDSFRDFCESKNIPFDWWTY